MVVMKLNKSHIITLLQKYPDLHYVEDLDIIKGVFHINHRYKGEYLVNEYSIEIRLDDNVTVQVPRVYEQSGKIPCDYSHVYKDGMLCLSTSVEQNIHFINGGTLVDWFESYLIPYFFSMEYFKKYGVYPDGERTHNKLGIVESYAELFEVDNEEQVIRMLDVILNKKFRGHHKCPCESGRRVRDCHREIILEWKQEKYKKILDRDFQYLMKGRD